MTQPVYIIEIIQKVQDDDEKLDPVIKTQLGSYEFTIEILKKIKNGGNSDEHGTKFFSDIYPWIHQCVCMLIYLFNLFLTIL